SDVWAFGCVLYEMLTGTRCFDGEDVADTLAFVLTKEPDWSALLPSTPLLVGNLLRRSLEKDRRKRVADISTARFVIDEAAALGPPALTDGIAVQPRIDAAVTTALAQLRGVMRVRFALMGATTALVVGAGIWYATRPTPPRVVQLAIPTTPATALAIDGN